MAPEGIPEHVAHADEEFVAALTEIHARRDRPCRADGGMGGWMDEWMDGWMDGWWTADDGCIMDA